MSAVLAAGAVVAGCGGSGEEDDVRRAVVDTFVAFVEGDGARLCDGLTTGVVDDLNARIEANYPQAGDRTCSEAIELLVPEGAAQFAEEARRETEVTDIEVDGDTATAKTHNADSAAPDARIELVKVGDEWLISDPGRQLAPAVPSDGATRETVSKPEAIDRADAICRDTRAALVELGRGPSYTQLARARVHEERSAEIEREPLLALEALLPPSRDRRLYDDFVAALKVSRELGLEAVEHLEEGRESIAAADVRQRQAVIAEGAKAAAAYGFNVCGRPAGGWSGFSP